MTQSSRISQASSGGYGHDRRAGPHRERRLSPLVWLSSGFLILLGLLLLAVGSVCRTVSDLPDWLAMAPLTAGIVIVLFVMGRHS